jgi:uncharacterized linocin/CFP29 family protein
MANDPQVPWTEEQWARVNQVIQEEAKRARVAATFLPLYGPLDADADFIRRQEILYTVSEDVRDAAVAERDAATQQFQTAARVLRGVDGDVADLAAAFAAQERIARVQAILARRRLGIDDRDTMRLATLQVIVPVRNAQMADPEMSSVLTLFRRAANVVARLEDAVVFRGLAPDPTNPGEYSPPAGIGRLPAIWQITGAREARGIWTPFPLPGPRITIPGRPPETRGQELVGAISEAIGELEQNGQFGPFAAVLDQQLFLVAQTPDPGSFVLPQDRIIPFLGGGPLLRSTTFDAFTGVVVALGGAPLELVVASDMSVQFLQVSSEPLFMFRVSEKIALRVREPDAIVRLFMDRDVSKADPEGGGRESLEESRATAPDVAAGPSSERQSRKRGALDKETTPAPSSTSHNRADKKA